MTRDQYLKNLRRIQKKLCSYTGQPCDCKFIQDKDIEICRGSENGSGCCEIFMAIYLIGSMTPSEFKKISKRAKMNEFFDDIKSEPKKKTKKTKSPKIAFDYGVLSDVVQNFTESLINSLIISPPLPSKKRGNL